MLRGEPLCFLGSPLPLDLVYSENCLGHPLRVDTGDALAEHFGPKLAKRR